MEDDSSFELEVQALQSIHGDDVNITRECDGGRVTQILVSVHPATGEDVEKQYLSIEVIFSIPEKYPEEAPVISFRNPRGLSEEETERLLITLTSTANESIGTEMLLPLTDAVKDCLTAHNAKPHGQCCICLDEFDPKEGITRTTCCHCFHSHCLADYIAHAIKELASPKGNSPQPAAQRTSANSSAETSFLCPTCRVPMQPLDISYLRKQPPPIDKPMSHIDIHSQTLRFQQQEFFTQLRLAREAREAKAKQEALEEFEALVLNTAIAGKAAAEGAQGTADGSSGTNPVSVDSKCEPTASNVPSNLPARVEAQASRITTRGDTDSSALNSSGASNSRDFHRHHHYNNRNQNYGRSYGRQDHVSDRSNSGAMNKQRSSNLPSVNSNEEQTQQGTRSQQPYQRSDASSHVPNVSLEANASRTSSSNAPNPHHRQASSANQSYGRSNQDYYRSQEGPRYRDYRNERLREYDNRSYDSGPRSAVNVETDRLPNYNSGNQGSTGHERAVGDSQTHHHDRHDRRPPRYNNNNNNNNNNNKDGPRKPPGFNREQTQPSVNNQRKPQSSRQDNFEGGRQDKQSSS